MMLVNNKRTVWCVFFQGLLWLCLNNYAAADSTILRWPMPCGEEMQLKKIHTQTDNNWLSDKELKLGFSGSLSPWFEYTRDVPLVGSLADNNRPDRRYFLMGVYELTQSQYDAVMNPNACNEKDKGKLPARNVSWFDAIDFTRRYTEWLSKNHWDLVTKQVQNRSIFVRLPTEAEWEFAARGGEAVPDRETFEAPLPPMKGSISNYAWHIGQQSCNGEIQDVGLKQPNPLGLYDMIGNVQEIVLEPFRFNVAGRLLGQAGGFIARGGSCTTPKDLLTSAYRTELDYYATTPRIANKNNMTGFRIVVASKSYNPMREDELKRDFDALRNFERREHLEQNFQQINEAKIQEDIKSKVAKIKEEFDLEIAQRNRSEKRSIRTMLRSAALTIRNYRDDNHKVKTFNKVCHSGKNDTNDPNRRSCLAIPDAQARLAITRSLYGELLFQVSEDFSYQELVAQREIALKPISASPKSVDFIDLFLCHVNRYQKQKPPNLDRYFEEIIGFDKRPEMKCG